MTFEQFQELRRRGLTEDQILKFESGYVPPESPGSPEHIQAAQQAAREASEEAQRLGSPGEIALGAAKRFPGEVAKQILQGPAKFIASAAEAPRAIKTGIPSGREYNLPIVGRFKSFESEAGQRAIEGQNPLLNIGEATLGTVGTGLETLGLIQGIQRGGKTALGYYERQKAQKALEGALSATEPVLSKAEKIQTLKAAGRPGGAKESGRILKTIERQPNARDIEVANAAKEIGIVDSKNPVKNIKKVNAEIGRISENEIRPFLKENPRTFNNAHLESRLRAIDSPDLVKADTTLERAYELVRNRVMKTVQTGKHTMEGLWDSRKILDKTMEREFGDALWNPENALHVPVKRAYLDMRREINNFIVDNIGVGGEKYAQFLKKETLLYDAATNIAEQTYKLLGKSGFARFIQKYRRLITGAELLGVGGVGGIIGAGTSRVIRRQ